MTNKKPHCDSLGCWERVTRKAPTRPPLYGKDPVTDPPYAPSERSAAEIKAAVESRWLDKH
jgi:hypothetical protein